MTDQGPNKSANERPEFGLFYLRDVFPLSVHLLDEAVWDTEPGQGLP